MDGGPWKPARLSDGYWWHDWTGYGSGGSVVCARILRESGVRTRCAREPCAWHCPRPRGGMRDRLSASAAGIGAALGQLENQRSSSSSYGSPTSAASLGGSACRSST